MTMLNAIGLLLLLAGIVSLLFGDRIVSDKGGWIIRTLSWPKGSMKWAKWPIGAALIYAGTQILMKGPPL